MNLVEKTVITRKEHVCWGCGRLYKARTSMLMLITPVYSPKKTITATYYCKTCEDFLTKHEETIRAIISAEDGLLFGELATMDEYPKDVPDGLSETTRTVP